MKAWHCFDPEPGEADLLVFADTRNRARLLAYENGTWDYDEFINVHAKRAPEWDGLFDCEKVIDTNEDLPAGSKPFYNDEGY